MRSKKTKTPAPPPGSATKPPKSQPTAPDALATGASEAEYRLLVERLNVGVFHSTLDGRFVHLNQTVADLAGYSVDELMSMPSTCLYADVADRDRLKRDLLRDGEIKDWEVRSVRKDGTEHWLSLNAVLQRDEHGTPATIIGIMADVSERKRVERQLQHVLGAVESTSEAIGISDAEGRHVYQNRALSELFGYANAEDLQAAGGGQAVVKDPDVARQMFENIQSGKPWSGELEMVTKNGHVFPAYEHADAIRDAEGNLIGLVGVITDFTERKRAEDALRLFRDSVQYSSDAVGMSTPDGRHYYQNEAFDRLFGDLRDRPPRSVYVDDATGEQVFDAIMAGGSWLGEVEMFAHDGTVRTILLRAYSINDQTGRVLGLVGVHTDITARKKTEEALRESVARTRAMLQANPDPMFRLDRQGIILDFKADAKDLYASSETSILGKRIRDFLPPTFADLLGREILATLESGSLRTFEYQLTPPGGSLRDYEARMVPSGADEVTAVVRDVTDVKRAEAEAIALEQKLEQTQRLESLGVLAGGIAHDFNNLLAAIMGNASLALDTLPPDAPARADIEEIDRAARRAADLTRQMLAYAGKSRLVASRVDVSALVQELSQMLRTVISKKAALTMRLEDGLPAIEADPGQVRQVVMNLMINASEAIGPSDGVISLTTGAKECDAEYLRGGALDDELPPGRYVYVEISDTGCGMDEATVRRIFEPFFTTKFLGRGLGMSAVLGILRTHRGTIYVRSMPGAGSTFTVLFPALSVAAGERDTRGPEATPLWLGKGTVLLVDDEEVVRSVGERLLRRIGFDVVSATDGRHAVDVYRARSAEFALVLCDTAMPQMDGFETFRALREINPAVKVVMTSGYAEQMVVPQFADGGIAGFIQKPFSLEALREVLRNGLVAPH